MKNEIVSKYRFRRNDYLLKPWEPRTYMADYLLSGILISGVAFTAFSFSHNLILGGSFSDFVSNIFNSTDSEIIKISKDKLMFFASSAFFIGAYFSNKMVKPVKLTKISTQSEHFYYSDSVIANYEFHQSQRQRAVINFKNPPENSLTLVSPQECKGKDKIFQPIQINANAAILAAIMIGIAGSGKSAYLSRLYEQVLVNGHKLIVHAPDSKARDMIVASGYSCMVSAPWAKSSIYIDLAATLDVDDMNLKNALIDLVITSFFGYVDPSSGDAFFQNGAVFVLTASLRKLCNVQPGKWTLEDWKDELISKSEIWEFKSLVDTYYPEASFTISEEAEKMTAAIIASITMTLVSIGRLSLYYKQCRKAVDIRKWCLDEVEKQAIILCSDSQYEEISRINIALFVNLTIPFLLSSDREKVFNKNKIRVYSILDEFPNFARNIDTNKWIRLVNEGRKFGNSCMVIAQNTPQFIGCFTGKNAQADAKKFIGSFHTQYIAQPSSEDESFINSIVGDITWDDSEASQSKDANGKTTVTYQSKARKEPIAFKKLQSDLGVQYDKKGKAIGVCVAVRLFESQVTAPLFFPFVNEFAKSKRDSMRERIVIKDNREYVKTKAGLAPLFFTEDKIILTRTDEKKIYALNELGSKQRVLINLVKAGKLKEAQQIENDIILLKSELQIIEELIEEKESKEADIAGKTGTEIALEVLDPSGAGSTLMHAAELFDSLSDDLAEGESQINIANNREIDEPKKIFKKKNNEMEI